MIAKPIALMQVPNQRMFAPKAAARYLGVHVDLLKQLTDLGEIPTRKFRVRRAYLLEDLDAFIEKLPRWESIGCYDAPRQEPASLEKERSGHGNP